MIEYVILEGPTTTLECAYEPGMQTQASATRRGARRSAMGRVEEQGKRKDAGIVVWIRSCLFVASSSRRVLPGERAMRSGTGPGWPVASPRVRAARDDPGQQQPGVDRPRAVSYGEE
jgi:hypothetical protein